MEKSSEWGDGVGNPDFSRLYNNFNVWIKGLDYKELERTRRLIWSYQLVEFFLLNNSSIINYSRIVFKISSKTYSSLPNKG